MSSFLGGEGRTARHWAKYSGERLGRILSRSFLQSCCQDKRFDRFFFFQCVWEATNSMSEIDLGMALKCVKWRHVFCYLYLARMKEISLSQFRPLQYCNLQVRAPATSRKPGIPHGPNTVDHQQLWVFYKSGAWCLSPFGILKSFHCIRMVYCTWSVPNIMYGKETLRCSKWLQYHGPICCLCPQRRSSAGPLMFRLVWHIYAHRIWWYSMSDCQTAAWKFDTPDVMILDIKAVGFAILSSNVHPCFVLFCKATC